MKYLSILFLLLLSKGYSQDVDPVNIVDYQLLLEDDVSSITISINKLSTADRKLIFQTKTRSCNFQQGIIVTFLNKETLKLRDHDLKCKDLENGEYLLSGTVLLDDALYEKIGSTDLLEFQLGTIRIPIKYEGYENLPNLIAMIKQDK